MKTYDYIVTLQSKGKFKIDWINILMLVITLVCFVGAAIQQPGKHNIGPLTITVLIIGWMIFCFWQERRGVQPFYRLALLLAAVGWFMQGGYGLWIALVYLVAAVLERLVKFPEEIAFDETEIVINSLPKKRVLWNELNNVVLKDGLLTIDFKNNKLFQREVNDEVASQTETEFNSFCVARLKQEKV